MLDPFRDRLDIRDKEVEIGLRCAKCKELVESGEEHTCKTVSSEPSAVSSEQKRKQMKTKRQLNRTSQLNDGLKLRGFLSIAS